jgi:hypothetical protein
MSARDFGGRLGPLPPVELLASQLQIDKLQQLARFLKTFLVRCKTKAQPLHPLFAWSGAAGQRAAQVEALSALFNAQAHPLGLK